jgi:hypothetical protein
MLPRAVPLTFLLPQGLSWHFIGPAAFCPFEKTSGESLLIMSALHDYEAAGLWRPGTQKLRSRASAELLTLKESSVDMLQPIASVHHWPF